MKLKEVLENSVINSDSVQAIEEHYAAQLSDEVRKVISVSNETTSLTDRSIFRILSLDEILDASDDMSVDFISKEIIPIIDVGDNDYITFDYKNQHWSLFNIADEILFDDRESVIDYV